MFANFTEETCTGTGVTLALAGITTGNIAFSKSFADGDLVAYVLEDSGGTIKVAGVGTYVSATDDITRNDTWNWNGTVVDENPSTNITLSSGTHTVRCDLVNKTSPAKPLLVSGTAAQYRNIRSFIARGEFGGTSLTMSSSIVNHTLVFIPAGVILDAITFNVSTAIASSLTRVGVSLVGADGQVIRSVAESANIDTSTTGFKTATFTAFTLPVDSYAYMWISSDSAIVVTALDRRYTNQQIGAPYNSSNNGRLYAGFDMSTTVAPAYPVLSAFSTTLNYQWADLMLRWT